MDWLSRNFGKRNSIFFMSNIQDDIIISIILHLLYRLGENTEKHHSWYKEGYSLDTLYCGKILLNWEMEQSFLYFVNVELTKGNSFSYVR